jgi:diacylglycerol kinase (ATP)
MPGPFLALLNPAAGRGRTRQAWHRIASRLERAGARHELIHTTAPGEVERVVRKRAGEEWEAIVLVGGDGTVHEAANGLLQAGLADPPPLGVIPLGTGNDFAKQLGLAAGRIEPAVATLLGGRRIAADVGMVDGRVFVNGFGFGIDGQVAAAVTRTRGLPGPLVYPAAIVQALGAYTTPEAAVHVDGQLLHQGSITLVAVANGGCQGGSFWFTPGAAIDDGRLDVLVAEGRTRAALLPLIAALVRRRHLGQPGVFHRTGTEVTIESEAPLPVHLDGEALAGSHRELTVRIRAGSLPVLRATDYRPRHPA